MLQWWSSKSFEEGDAMVAADDVDFLAKKLRDAHVRFVSSGVIAIPKDKAGFTKGALVSDPDGHSVLLIQN